MTCIVTPGKANFLFKKGAKLNRLIAPTKEYDANLEILVRQSDDENEENDSNQSN